MLIVEGVLRWRIGQVRTIENEPAKVFHWLTKQSPIRKLITSVSFSYPRGWEIERLIPMDCTMRELDALQVETMRMLGKLPIPSGSDIQIVDFVLPYVPVDPTLPVESNDD